jgi:hypothetical protein
MLSLDYIMKVGRMMEQTGGQDAQRSMQQDPSVHQAHIERALKNGEYVVRVNIQEIITAEGEVCLFNAIHPLPEGARLTDYPKPVCPPGPTE